MNIFILHSRIDRYIESDVYYAIQDSGYSVWIDFPYSPNEYEDTIRKYMLAAQLLVAIWTPASAENKLFLADWKIASQLKKRVLPGSLHELR